MKKVRQVEKEVNGKKEQVQEEYVVPVQQTYTETVSVPVWYEATETKTVYESIQGTDPIVRVRGLDGKLLQKITETAPVSALAWSDDGIVLATACDRNDSCSAKADCAPLPCDGSSESNRSDLRFWDPATGKLLFALPCGSQQVAIIAFSPLTTILSKSLEITRKRPSFSQSFHKIASMVGRSPHTFWSGSDAVQVASVEATEAGKTSGSQRAVLRHGPLLPGAPTFGLRHVRRFAVRLGVSGS